MKKKVTLDLLDNNIALVTMQDVDGRNIFSDSLIHGLIDIIKLSPVRKRVRGNV